jgi:6-phosphogluconolactonase
MRTGIGKTEVIRFPDARALADAVAREWIQEAEQAVAKAGTYCVALSGGRSARQLFAAAVQLAKGGAAKESGSGLGAAHFFWGDERCVPPDDTESNFGLAREVLLGPLGVSGPQIHRVRGELLPEQAAAAAAAELGRVASVNSDGQPVLDLIFLGMGEEGHVASLFPGESEVVMESPAVYRAVTASKPPPRRITLGYAAIAAARQVWVLASGPGKEGALRASLEPAGKTPLGRVLKLRDCTRVFTDLIEG